MCSLVLCILGAQEPPATPLLPSLGLPSPPLRSPIQILTSAPWSPTSFLIHTYYPQTLPRWSLCGHPLSYPFPDNPLPILMSFLFATIRLFYSLHTPTQKWAKTSEETRTLWHPKDIFVMAPIVETRKIGKEWARGADSNPDALVLESVEGEATSFPNKSSIDLKFPQWWENQKEISVCWLVEMEMCYFGIFRSKWPTGNTRSYLTKKYRETRQAVFYNYYSTHAAATTQKFTCVLTAKTLPWTLHIYTLINLVMVVLTCYRMN